MAVEVESPKQSQLLNNRDLPLRLGENTAKEARPATGELN